MGDGCRTSDLVRNCGSQGTEIRRDEWSRLDVSSSRGRAAEALSVDVRQGDDVLYSSKYRGLDEAASPVGGTQRKICSKGYETGAQSRRLRAVGVKYGCE